MRIRKLELQGFKSFVDRQTFHFGSGIAGVVGPNGCGKSNVVDAVKWCIGEQSAKSLRGANMADVIFNGSATRPPVGMAEVTLTFAADEEPFPGRWARFEEIGITRRLFRDGASEYRINQERVRLRDVHDLFLDTGVGTQLYSFIEQGRVDRIVLSRPEQRRTLIEEAAGISRYKARRAEALDKLEQTSTNLDRVSEIADDMKRRLRSLERQVEKAARYRRLRATVRQGELLLGLARYAGLTEDRRALVGDLRAAKVGEETAARTLAAKEQGLRGVRDRIAVAETLTAELRDRFAELEAQRRESESARHYQAKEREDLTERLAGLEQELKDWTTTRGDAQAETDRLAADLARWQEAVSGQRSAVESAEAHARETRGDLASARVKVEADKRTITALLTDATRTRATLAGNERAQQDLAERRDRAAHGDTASRTGLDALRESLTGAEAGLAVADQAVATAAQARNTAREALAQARMATRAHVAALRDVERQRTQAERVLARVEARRHSLQELFDAHDGVEGGARDVLGLPGVLGTLAEHLDVAEADLPLLQATLGDALEHVVVADVPALLAAAAAATGRIGLVSTDGAPAAGDLAARFGGTASGQAAVARLLARWQHAPDLAAALDTHAATGHPVVADDGTRVDAQGVVWAGPSGRSAGQIILDRRRELTDLATQVAQDTQALAATQSDVESADAALSAARIAESAAVGVAEQADGDWRSSQLVQAEARQRLRLKAQELRQSEGRARELAAERERLDASAAGLAAEAAQARLRLSEFEGQQADAETGLLQRQSQLQGLEDAATRAGEALASLRAERDGGHRQVQVLTDSLAVSRQRLEEAVRRLDRATQETATSQARIAELGVEHAALSERIAVLGHEQGDARTRLDTERGRLAEDRDKLRVAEEGLRGLRDRRERCTATRTRLELKVQEVRLQIDGIKAQVEQRYEVSLPAMLDRLDRNAALVLEAGEAASQPLPETVRELPGAEDVRITPALLEDRDFVSGWVDTLEASREQLRRLGEVNLTALEEYLEIQEKWTWLEEQRGDLARSTEAIRKAIADINRTCRARFRDTFDRVDKAFQELYPRLVGGGEARLALTDEDDLLETGVEIYARPPGKRMQSLRLLSGGEKAMTAIGLIFAIFTVKPSPFCMLDEVDAPLDEGNGARFNDLLRQMSELSQFIVVTHNKKTMESVDTLYGVTMPDPGTSRLVTVRIA